MFEIGWLAHSLHHATRSGGRLLFANTISHDDGIMSPWLIRSYGDILRHVSCEVVTDEILRGTKDSVEFDVLITLFRKAGERSEAGGSGSEPALG